MSKEPLHPLDIPEDTSSTGVVGWMFESVARSFALRLAALVALLGAAVAAVRVDAPPAPRLAAVVLGILVAFVLLVSQLKSWRRSLQWALIVASALACGTLLAVVVRLG